MTPAEKFPDVPERAVLPFPSEELLCSCERGDRESAALLDSMGFLIAPGETPAEYVSRIRTIRRHAEEADRQLDGQGTFDAGFGIKVRKERRIPVELMAKEGEVTQKKYGFSLRWAPGYFLDDGLSFLWGGCTVADETPGSLPVFIIRKDFEKKDRWFIYSRLELLSHEICHAARMPLRDRALEEHFAYGVSSSRFRRTVGNCFQADWDAILFILPVFLLLASQIAINVFEVRWLNGLYFWVGAFVWPLFLLLRNHFQRSMYFHAEEALKKEGWTQPEAVLFRCTSDEIFDIARDGGAFLTSPDAEFRFQVITKRFFRKERRVK